MRRTLLLMLFAPALWAQAPVITSFTTDIPGVTAVGPGTEIYILGTFTPHSAGRDYTITVGGQTGGINVADGADFISATIPAATPAGATTLVVTYQGQTSNAIPITIGVPVPLLEGVGVLISSATAPPQFTEYTPIMHNGTGGSVTPTSPAALGEVLQVLVSGLGPDVAPAVSPTISVGGQNAQIDTVSVVSGGGRETLYFTVPLGAPVGIDQVVVTVDGVPSNSVGIPVGAGPLVGMVLNGANFGSKNVIAPGSIVSVFGAGFGTQNNLSAFPSTSVNGVSVMFGTTAAPIFALAATVGQINVLVPTELPSTGTVDLSVQTSGGTSPPQTLNLAPAAPGIFYYTDPLVLTRHNAVAVTANTAWIAMPSSMAANLGLSTSCGTATTLCGQPAKPGAYLQIYATGLGKATPNGDPNGAVLPTGSLAPSSGNPLYETVEMPTVTIGGEQAQVVFSGVAPGYEGLYQVDVQIPSDIAAGNDVPLVITTGPAADSATIAIQ
ncbi:MAG: hypothetical protein JOZ32_07650 [Bryobacterales bacterium]|nr:hypothetical protein [Bryobacterales bacterium]